MIHRGQTARVAFQTDANETLFLLSAVCCVLKLFASAFIACMHPNPSAVQRMPCSYPYLLVSLITCGSWHSYLLDMLLPISFGPAQVG